MLDTEAFTGDRGVGGVCKKKTDRRNRLLFLHLLLSLHYAFVSILVYILLDKRYLCEEISSGRGEASASAFLQSVSVYLFKFLIFKKHTHTHTRARAFVYFV